MTDEEKKVLQAKHRVEAAEARSRVQERKARTRRLIQEGALTHHRKAAVVSPSGIVRPLRWEDLRHGTGVRLYASHHSRAACFARCAGQSKGRRTRRTRDDGREQVRKAR